MIGNYKEFKPEISENARVAKNATVIGKCTIGKDSSIWYSAVLRGDAGNISIGERTNIQDGAVLHSSTSSETILGNDITVGHNAIIHACTIHDNCLIGMGSTVLDGATIEENVIVGANSLITSGKLIQKNSLVMGSPAKVIRELTDDEVTSIRESALCYIELSKDMIQ